MHETSYLIYLIMCNVMWQLTNSVFASFFFSPYFLRRSSHLADSWLVRPNMSCHNPLAAALRPLSSQRAGTSFPCRAQKQKLPCFFFFPKSKCSRLNNIKGENRYFISVFYSHICDKSINKLKFFYPYVFSENWSEANFKKQKQANFNNKHKSVKYQRSGCQSLAGRFVLWLIFN